MVTSHANVWNDCLRILRKRGYELSLEADMDDGGSIISESRTWWAKRADFIFSADNPLELLGLTAICDFVRPEKNESYWWNVEGDDIWTELDDKAFPDSD